MSTEDERIICRTTPWYHKRRIAMMILVFGLSIYFFYDWKVGYPLKRDAAEKMLELKKQNREAEYAALAKEKGWPETPNIDKDWNYAIGEQLVSGILTGVLGVVMLFFYIRTVRGALTADADSFDTVDGQHVPFASAFRIDRRKWDHKGLAYVFYKNDKGEEKRAVIDDLIFGGAVKVLDRLQANFKGEIIDLEKEEEPASAEALPEKTDKEAEGESEASPAQ
ncbi:MAG TPA: hypothetical protein VG796_12660 [Verrucomicrobiales bacterium]|nr:hypothetical protein [Verrucomicrobiales bacterium]